MRGAQICNMSDWHRPEEGWGSVHIEGESSCQRYTRSIPGLGMEDIMFQAFAFGHTSRKNSSVEYEVQDQPRVEQPVGRVRVVVGPAGGPRDARIGQQVHK
jgi:hypothetical protein